MRFINQLKRNTVLQLFKKILKPVYDKTLRLYENSYAYWIHSHEKQFVSKLLHESSTSTSIGISLFTPILNKDDLTKIHNTAISVQNQTVQTFGWVIAVAENYKEELIQLIGSDTDSSIEIITFQAFHEINSILTSCKADFLAFLEAGDQLQPWTIQVVNQFISTQTEASVFYSDEDHLTPKGKRTDPWLKAEFNLYNLRSANFLRHFLIVRKSLGDAIGWFGDISEVKLPWYNLALRLAETEQGIHHIPYVLYHNNILRPPAISDKTLWESDTQDRIAFESHLARLKVNAEVLANNYTDSFRVRYTPQNEPLVSILIPNRNQTELLKRCIDSIREETTWKNYEILIIENNSDENSIFEYYRSLQNDLDFPGKVLYWPDEFNYSAINNWAVDHSKGDVLVFLNNDTEVISPEWLHEMVGLAQQPDVGAVGAKLLFPDHTIQHAGIGMGNFSDQFFFHIAEWLPASASGYYGWVRKTNAVIAVTGACLMIENSKFLSIGGFDPNFPDLYNDNDLCLNLLSRGYKNLYIPYVKLIHHESLSRSQTISEEKYSLINTHFNLVKKKWPLFFDQVDPYFSKTLRFDHFYQDRIE